MTTDHIAELLAQLKASALDRGYLVTGDDHVSEVCAAELLGRAPGTLRNWRHAARPLPFRRLGGTRGRVSYSLAVLAAFLVDGETRECTDANDSARLNIADGQSAADDCVSDTESETSNAIADYS